jgi:hypothetical protein
MQQTACQGFHCLEAPCSLSFGARLFRFEFTAVTTGGLASSCWRSQEAAVSSSWVGQVSALLSVGSIGRGLGPFAATGSLASLPGGIGSSMKLREVDLNLFLSCGYSPPLERRVTRNLHSRSTSHCTRNHCSSYQSSFKSP